MASARQRAANVQPEGVVCMGGTYRSRPIKRLRRSREQLDALRAAIYDTLAADHPQTVRQCFYRLVSQGAIEKTEQEYKNAVVRLLGIMRLDGQVPFGWISDNTRWMRKPRSYSDIEEALAAIAHNYRRSLWDNQDVYVEVWTEKDALAGVLHEVTRQWDVPLMVSRGFSSLSYLYEAAEAISEQGKPAYLYYFGDHDPSGVHIDRSIEQRLREFAPDALIHFERVAVVPEQIEHWALPTRPTKRTDSRSKNFEGESVEVDAIPPQQLRQLVTGCIEQHVDRHAVEVLRTAERSEREMLRRLCEQLHGRPT
jgi:hypothetical protein